MVALDIDEDRALAMVESGRIPGFDLRIPGAKRREVRVLTKAVDDFTKAAQPLEAKAIIDSIFPARVATLSIGRLRAALMLSHTHITRLASRCLKLVRRERPKMVDIDSLRTFLLTRAI